MHQVQHFIYISLISLVALTQLNAQDQGFHVKVSADTILMGNVFEVTFTLENVTGKIEPPAFESFEQVGGQSQSSSISIVNGNVTQQHSYSYMLEPKSEGIFLIEPATAYVEDEVMKTKPLQIVVIPNPDGIIQSPGRKSQRGYWEDTRPESKPKPKKPITKL